jgi:Ca2+-binding EF-hand superfamily protein
VQANMSTNIYMRNMKARAEAVVKKVDANGDARVSTNEIRKFLMSQFESVMEQDVEARTASMGALFQKADSDGDGKLTKAEIKM